MNGSVVGLDIAKNVFHVYGMTAEGEVIKQVLKRKQVLEYFANRLALLIGIEACAGAHYWARELEKLGHRVKLLLCSAFIPRLHSFPDLRVWISIALTGRCMLRSWILILESSRR